MTFFRTNAHWISLLGMEYEDFMTDGIVVLKRLCGQIGMLPLFVRVARFSFNLFVGIRRFLLIVSKTI